jgi:hypothetical protein
MKFTIETDKEVDGRWIAEIVEMSGVMVYGVHNKRLFVK